MSFAARASRSSRTRRSFLRGLAAGMTIPLTVAGRHAFAQTSARPKLHALIIGMNVYTGHVGRDDPRSGRCIPTRIPQLRGCINDARAIEASVRPLAASTRVLLDEQVNRASFVGAWRDMVANAALGDTLLLTYSGHGGQEPEHVKGSEPSGFDDTLILSPFDTCMPSLREERIIDDEIAGLFSSIRGRNKVIFVADACHSGTMTRGAVDARIDETLTYRKVPAYDYASAMPSAVKIDAVPDNDDQPHVLFFAGCEDDESVPEIRINGAFHGALSVAFAQALAGRADANQDGVITGAELSAYVLRTVRGFSDSSQHPEVHWPHADAVSGSEFKPEDPVFFRGTAAVPRPPSGATVVRLRILGDQPAAASLAQSLSRVTIVGRDDPADVVWDSEPQRVLDPMGSVLAWNVAAADLQPVIDAAIALDAVRQMVADSGIDMRLMLPGEQATAAPSRASDRTHPEGTRLTLTASGMRYPYFALFDITGNGTVQLLYPCRGQAGSCRTQHDAPTIKAQEGYRLPLDVTAPFGADRVIAISSAHPLSDLIAVLESVDGRRNSMTVIDALGRVADQPDVQVGMQAIFTAAR